MKILITGGAGYVGNIVTDTLLDKGYDVTVFDNLIHRQHGILEQCAHKKFKFEYGDVRNEGRYTDVLSDKDVVINLAAYVGAPLCNRFPIEAVQVNHKSVEFLSRQLGRNQLAIFSCTNSVYGLGNADGSICNEETPAKPISIYGQTKLNAENALMQRENAISLRLATVFGVSRKMRMDLLLNEYVWRAWSDNAITLFEPKMLRNWVHIRDVADTIVFAIENQARMKGNIFNVGNSEINISKKDLCEAIKRYVPQLVVTESTVNKDPDQRNYRVSNAKLEALGWKCNYSVSDGIIEILKACPIIKHTNVPFSDI